MKRKRVIVKALLILVSALAAIIVILALTISPIAKSYIENHSKELIGRKVSMRGLHINIFTGTLEVDSIHIYEANDNQIFASVDTFFVDLALQKLINKTIEISEMKVVRPSVVILQDKYTFNFDDLMSKKNGTDTAKSSFLKSIILRNIDIRGGKITYTDVQSGSNIIASVRTAATNLDTLYLPASTYLFNTIHASNVDLSVILKPTTHSDTYPHKPEEQNARPDSAASHAMAVRIRDLHIDDSQCTFTDSTLATPLNLPVSNIDIQVTNFDLNSENEISAKALFPEGGSLRFSWKGNLNNFANQQIMVDLQNLSLRLFSPYCMQYTAYDITEGNLNFMSKNLIRQNNIESINLLDAYKIDVGKKHPELKPSYNVPLGLALYILKDKDDKIAFDVPVKGNIKDPQFSYSKIIVKTLINLMVKIAVSPIRFLASSLGMNADKMESMAIEPLQTDFTAEQYRQMNDLVSIAKKKPDMTLTLTQYVNLKEEVPTYALYKTKTAFLAATRKGGKSEPLRYDEVELIEDNDTNFTAYLDTLAKAKGVEVEGASVQEKVNSLYATDSLRAELKRILDQRNELLIRYMTTTYAIPKRNLAVKTADEAALDTYSDKPLYKIEMSLPGVENTTKSAKETKKMIG